MSLPPEDAASLAEHIRRLKPELGKVLGHSETGIIRPELRADIDRLQALADGFDDHAEKPLSEDVVETLRDVLARLNLTLEDFLRLGDESAQPAPEKQSGQIEALRQLKIRLEALVSAASRKPD